MTNEDRAVVVGAGVAGLWTAWALARRGIAVTLLDAGKPGSGASWGNAGWICPSQAGPLPEEGLVLHGLRDMFHRDPSLRIEPSALRLVPWLARFATYCNAEDFEIGITALSTLGYPSFELIKQLGLDEHCDKTGLLLLSRKRSDVEHFIHQITPLASLGDGPPSDIVTGSALQDIDPIVPDGYFGARLHDHWQVVPHVFNEALLQRVRGIGVEVIADRAATGFESDGDRVRAVLTEHHRYEADHVVIATGAEAGHLTRRLGHRLPLIGAKGYSVDVTPGMMPRQAIQTLDSHLAISPMGDRLRIVGGFDLSTDSRRIPSRRVDTVKRKGAEFLGPFSEESAPWTGPRPVAPDGMPLIGRIAPGSNVFVATGYSMLGMTISPAAGTFLADAIVNDDDGSSGSFSPQRFRFGARTQSRRSTPSAPVDA